MKILRSQSIWFAINEYFARNVKDKSDRILKFWIFQTESVLAQKIRQQQQKIALYMKIWEERALRELMQRFKKQMQRNAKGFFLLSSVGLCAFNWDSERINLNSIKHYFDEFDFINQLQKDTLYCNRCGKRKTINHRVEGIDYCSCQSGKNDWTNSADADGWEPYLERHNMITWRREEKKGLYAYKVYVKYPDVTAEDFLFVQTDVEYRKKWDSTTGSISVIDEDPKFSNSQIVYWEMLWPKLFANRDYVFIRRYFVDRARKIIVIVNKSLSTQHPKCPTKIKNQRVNEYWSYIAIKSNQGFRTKGLEFVLTYFDNPGLSIPKTLTTWVATCQMPDFLEKLYVATINYAEMKQGEDEIALGFWDKQSLKDPGFEYPPEYNMYEYDTQNTDTGDDDGEGNTKMKLSKLVKDQSECELICNAAEDDRLNDIAVDNKKRTSWWSYLHPYSYFV